ncbi:MAG: ROK family protein [Chloroflexi bacterium]|nr:ROK family protein [Chloroflexota bacterium]
MRTLGIDIGGSGIKGAIVETHSGKLIAERYRLPTPQPSKPKAVARTVAEIVAHFEWRGPIGCTFPAIVHHGVILSAANVHKAWIGADCRRVLREAIKQPVTVTNDADAAGVAEMKFGAGKGKHGLVIMITLGTGIGGAIFYNGVLVPNAELGHLQIRGVDAEARAAARVRTEENLSWKRYARRLNEYLSYVEFLFTPDLFIIGGGISADHRKFLPLLSLRTKVVPARLRNDAGIIGAGMMALGPRRRT